MAGAVATAPRLQYPTAHRATAPGPAHRTPRLPSKKDENGNQNLNHWTIRTRILASFTFILLVMALMGVVAYNRLSAIERETS